MYVYDLGGFFSSSPFFLLLHSLRSNDKGIHDCLVRQFTVRKTTIRRATLKGQILLMTPRGVEEAAGEWTRGGPGCTPRGTERPLHGPVSGERPFFLWSHNGILLEREIMIRA